MTITIYLRTVSEANQRTHWAVKAKRVRQQRTTVGLVVGAEMAIRGRIRPPCTVTLTRCAPSQGLDSDNLSASLKAVRDGVADALGLDDGDRRITWAYEQVRSKRGTWLVQIELVAQGNEKKCA